MLWTVAVSRVCDRGKHAVPMRQDFGHRKVETQCLVGNFEARLECRDQYLMVVMVVMAHRMTHFCILLFDLDLELRCEYSSPSRAASSASSLLNICLQMSTKTSSTFAIRPRISTATHILQEKLTHSVSAHSTHSTALPTAVTERRPSSVV